MKWEKRAAAFLAGALALLLSAAPGGSTEPGVESPHGRRDQKSCIVCHIAKPPKADGQQRPVELRFGGDIVALCSSCHQGYRHMHPVKIALAPDMKRSVDIPLDREHRITCVTCHDVMEREGVHRKRKIAGKQLCLNCHVDSDILAQVNWYPARLSKGEKGRLEIKAVEFRIPASRAYLGSTVFLYYSARNVDTGDIVFGTNILHDDGTHGDRQARDSVYTLIEDASLTGAKRRLVYTGWVMDAKGRRSNTVTLAVEYL
jgi:hypothetical protein